MALTLQDTINFSRPFVRYMDLSIGTSLNPAVNIATIVRNIILSAPFTWRFNRAVDTSITTVIGTQDYTVAISDFGFLEKCTLTDAQGNIFEVTDILNTQPLGKSADKQRPDAISVLMQTEALSPPGTTYTFRFMGVPDAVYTGTQTYQKLPVIFTALSDAWAPIPDQFSDIFNNLFLGYAMDSCQDPRAAQYIARGGAALLAKAEGLSEMDKAIFMQSFLNLDAAQIVNQLQAQQGVQSRGQK
jgi:hypothetical protein